jgi:hypothetical protein
MRNGSSRSKAKGLPAAFSTAQKRHCRVQLLPKIIKVSRESLKQLPWLGHLANLQTVLTLSSDNRRILDKAVRPGISCLNQEGSFTCAINFPSSRQ